MPASAKSPLGPAANDLPRDAGRQDNGGQDNGGQDNGGQDNGGQDKGYVIVVEDHGPTRVALDRLLRRQGLQTVLLGAAGDVDHWVRGHGRRMCDATCVAAFVDVHLPDGDGLGVTRVLRDTLGPGVPIIVVSGDTSMQTLSRLCDAGASRFVGKPVTPEAIDEVLRDSVEDAPGDC